MGVKGKMTAIADAIREKTGKTQALGLDAMAQSIPQVYDAGAKSEYDRFWDTFQKNGMLGHDYRNAFGPCWTKDNFYPKYDIAGANAGNGTFRFFSAERGTFDLAQRLEECGVVFDTSQSAIIESTFYGAWTSRVPVISAVSANQNGLVTTFAYSTIYTIDKLILRDDGTTAFSSTFTGCSNLTNMVIEGKIGKNGFNVRWSKKLTHDSLMSIIHALQDKTADTSGTSWVVTLGAENLAKLTDGEKAIATEKGWTLA